MNTVGKTAIGVALVVAVALAIFVVPAKQWTISFVEWMHGQGALAILIFAVAYIVAAVLLIPGSVLTLGAGFVYGTVWGALLVMPAATLAAMIAFAIARRLGRNRVAARVQHNPKFAALDRAIGRSGFKITLLVRLSPIFPFGLLNYALGVTKIRFRDYFWATALGMLPGTIAYVYLGSLVTSATELGSGSGRSWLYWLGGALTIVASIAITAIARQTLRRELAEVHP
ncbi:MAG: TVP38/TMEM64 family protein [Kofleriaceae bacterium]